MKMIDAIVVAISVGYLSIGASAQCPPDVITDGIVDSVDLAAILGAWGTSGGVHGGDIDLDGIVSGQDLAMVLVGWGPCPPAADCSQANWIPGADLHGCDFSGLQISNVNLSGANLRGANFSGANVSGANLSNTDLVSANFANAAMSGVNMLGANLTNSELTKATLSCTCAGANFTGASLAGATMTGDFQSAKFASANLTGASFTGGSWCYLMNLQGVNLSGANLTGACLDLVSLANANVTNAILTDVCFNGVRTGGLLGLPAVLGEYRMLGDSLLGPGVWLYNVLLEDLDLSNINLSRACFQSSALIRTNLTNAKLVGTLFNGPESLAGCWAIYNTGSQLIDVNLTGADLTGAWQLRLYSLGIIGTPAALPKGWQLISGCIISQGAKIGPADLSGLDLTGIDLHNTEFVGTNFRNTILTNANFSGSQWLRPDVRADFTNADLTGANFSWTHIGYSGNLHSTFTNANLTKTNFAGCSFEGIRSGGVVGTPIDIPSSHQLIAGYLIGPQAILYEANLSGLDLSGVNLDRARLSFANLRDTNLTGASLRQIFEWYAADFSNANLTNADFSWSAYLQYANFTNAIWSSTICPSGGEPQSCSCQTYPTGGCP